MPYRSMQDLGWDADITSCPSFLWHKPQASQPCCDVSHAKIHLPQVSSIFALFGSMNTLPTSPSCNVQNPNRFHVLEPDSCIRVPYIFPYPTGLCNIPRVIVGCLVSNRGLLGKQVSEISRRFRRYKDRLNHVCRNHLPFRV